MAQSSSGAVIGATGSACRTSSTSASKLNRSTTEFSFLATLFEDVRGDDVRGDDVRDDVALDVMDPVRDNGAGFFVATRFCGL